MRNRSDNNIPLKLLKGFILLLLPLLIAGCNSARHVPQGSYLLDQVSIRVDSLDGKEELDSRTLESYLLQEPNHRMLWSIKFRLGFYNLSGKDSTKFWNKWARKLGEPPVIYDSLLTAGSAEQLRKLMVNKGYLKSKVEVDTILNPTKRKIKVNYRILPGTPYRINSVDYQIEDSVVASIVGDIADALPVSAGNTFDRALLETQREMLTQNLRNRGYYGFSKENITFSADTTAGSTDVDLTMVISRRHTQTPTPLSDTDFDLWRIRNVTFITDYDPARDINPEQARRPDTVYYKNMRILYGENHYIRPQVLEENCFFRPGEIFRERESDRTYQALSRLSILKFINVRLVPVVDKGDLRLLDAYILLTPGKPMTASLEIEGTNSEGDLGVAVGVTFTHRNIGKGSETLSAKVQGSYEALSGNLGDLLHNRYMEYSADLSLTFPKFKAPFLSSRFRRRVNATSALNLSMNFQERPEYTRVISTAGWAYKWNSRDLRRRQTFTLVDINYVYLPAKTYDFLNNIAADNPLLRYSYEDHFIMRMGYNFYLTDRKTATPWEKNLQRSFYTFRSNIEIAGNLLFAISNIIQPGRNFHNDPYSIFGIRYSQYVKLEGDYSYLYTFDHRNSLALHVGAGIGIPYANSSILPFEKRFYGGGANGVRGWAVRTLGPGSYPGSNALSDFINQCGDIRLEFNAEYRAKLFWVLELGAFIDIGNIWTIRNYENQPGGVFRFDRFYEQFAAAYGLGLRLDFNYFLLRFDLGMKAHNPARGEKSWPLIDPNWHRDASFHFSIGYPF